MGLLAPPVAWIGDRWRRIVLGADVCAFLDTAQRTSAAHSLRSPKTDELQRLQATGQALLAGRRTGAAQRELISTLGKIALKLRDYHSLVALFETVLEREMPVRWQQMTVLVSAAKRVNGPPALAQRLNDVCNTFLIRNTRLSPSIREALTNRVSSPADRLTALRAVEPASRSPAEWEMLISLLLSQSEREDGSDLLTEAIAMLDQAWPVLSAGAGRRLMIWLAIIAAAKAAFAECCALSVTSITRAADRAPRIGGTVFHPLQVFEQFGHGPDRYAYAWAVMSIDVLWHVDFVSGPELRRSVLSVVLDGVAANAFAAQNPETIGNGIYRRIHQCEDLWGDGIGPSRLLERFVGVIGLFDEPRRTTVRGILHLAAGEEDAAETLFARRRGSVSKDAFNGHGHVSFVSPAATARYLEEPPTSPRLLPENCDFRFEKEIDRNPRRLAVITCADPAYANRYCRRYAQQLFRLDKRSTLHLHLLGKPDLLDDNVREMIARHPRISMTTEEPVVRMPYYYATARFLRAALLQQAMGSAILLTDIDETYTRSPGHLLDDWRRHGDVGLRLYDRIRTYPRSGMIGFKAPRMETWKSLGAACLYLGRTDRALCFGETLSQVAHHALVRARDNGNSNWWIDQNILYATLKPAVARIEELRLFNLFDAGLPFGKYDCDIDTFPPPRGHRPGMPDIPVVRRHADPA